MRQARWGRPFGLPPCFGTAFGSARDAVISFNRNTKQERRAKARRQPKGLTPRRANNPYKILVFRRIEF